MQVRTNPMRARRSRWSGQTWIGIMALLFFAAQGEVRAQGLRDSETNAWVEIRSVVVDGARIALSPGLKLRLDRQPRTVVFEFGPATNNARMPARVRFKLDGYEDQWREYEADMRLYLRFIDSRGDQVGETIFKVAGQTKGWTGDLRTAAFTHRRETVVVPPKARSFWVALTSAGPPDAVGVYAVADLVIKSSSSNDAPP